MPRYIEPSYEILRCPADVIGSIASAARTCYKSEHKATPESNERLVKHLISRGHMAMIEFGGVVVVKFISNRGFTHELVRHRLSSFGQESTRYCNYGKEKFGSKIRVLTTPDDWLKTRDDHDLWKALALFDHTHAKCEAIYLELLDLGVPAEIAREVLPIGLKAEIVIQANVREWRHIFGQRCSRKAHPRMRQLMIPLLKDLSSRCPLVFDDLAERFLSSRE